MSPRRGGVRHGVLSAAVAAGLLCAGCSTPAPAPVPAPVRVAPSPFPSAVVAPPGVAPGRAGTPRGAPTAPVNAHDPAAVAARFAATTVIVDTAIDRSSADAQRRAARWATPAYAAVLTAPVPVTGDHDFTVLAAHHGFTTAALVSNADDGRPPDLPLTAARSFTVTATGHGAHGWTQARPAQVMYVFLARTGPAAPWRVERVTVSATGVRK